MIAKEFITAGKSTFTFSVNAEYAAANNLKPHYTFKVVKKEANDRWPETYFVSVLTGPDNTTSYTYLGMLDPKNGSIRTTAKSCMTDAALPVRLINRTLALVWENESDKIVAAGFNLQHAGKCGRCGRKLTTPKSVEQGFGPECVSIMGL